VGKRTKSQDREGLRALARKGHKRTFIVIAALMIFLYVGGTFVQVWRLQGWDQTRNADAAIVLGAAQYNGRPSAVFKARLDRAADLYRQEVVRYVLVTGGSQEGDRYTEAYAGLKYLISVGVPAEQVIVVDDGSSTWESLQAAQRVLKAKNLKTVLLVSDPYHSLRLLGIGNEVGIEGYVSPTAGRSSFKTLVRETVLVSVGRIIGYRRMVALFE
jgi:vancomycin permeability regulator SanA